MNERAKVRGLTRREFARFSRFLRGVTAKMANGFEHDKSRVAVLTRARDQETLVDERFDQFKGVCTRGRDMFGRGKGAATDKHGQGAKHCLLPRGEHTVAPGNGC